MMSNGPRNPRSVLRRFRAPALVLLALALALAPRVAAAAAEIPNIVFLGDSLTAGLGLSNPGRESYPALIQDKLDAAGLSYRVINAGLSGDTTAGGVRRIDWTLRQPVDVLVLALGANDGLRGVAPSESQRNLQLIIQRVRSRYPRVKIVIAGMMMPENMGPEYTRAYRELFANVAAQNGAALVPFLLEGVGGVRAMNQGDGIHPNPAGHAVLAENVWKVLRPLL